MFVPLTVSAFLARGETVYPDRVGLVDEPDQPGGGIGSISYSQVAALARRMAAGLDNLGVGVGERVAVVSPNAGRVLVALFGVSGSGRVLVPVNYRLTSDEVRYIIEHSGSSVALVDAEYAQLVEALDVKHHIVLGGASDSELLAGADATPEPWAPDESATASINYTSGTTARPKGVQLSHRNLVLNALVFAWHVGVSDRDVYLHTLPMFHCNGWGMPYALAAMGVPQVVLRKVDGEEILRRIERHGVTLFNGAPAVVAAVLDAAERRRARSEPVPGAGRVRIVVAGAPPPSRVIERVESELGWEFIQIYGLTETSPLLTVNRGRPEWDALPLGDRAKLLARAGAPAFGVELRIDDEGEVLARSNHVFSGYWQQPEETHKAMGDGWFHTGDGGMWDGPYLTITDRKKDVIITGGENVSSIEVEDCLYQHPAVAEAAVIGVPDDKWGETVKALVVLREGATATEVGLIGHCRSNMAHYKCPTSVELRGSLPRTATGKLQKFRLREEFWAGHERQVN